VNITKKEKRKRKENEKKTKRKRKENEKGKDTFKISSFINLSNCEEDVEEWFFFSLVMSLV
jgi:hypothetical protein